MTVHQCSSKLVSCLCSNYLCSTPSSLIFVPPCFILNVSRTVSKVSLYIISGKLPIRYIIKTRRLMFLWHILNVNKSELIHKFYKAQVLSPQKDDWVHQVTQDKQELNIELSDDDILSMSKTSFKKYVMSKIESSARAHFEGLKRNHSNQNIYLHFP